MSKARMAGFLLNVGKAGEVAERSPAVISANLKEDMLLQKKITILNRSERSVVHQIKVDQKVVYKRFQSRLVRSKLGFARIMGNKDIEKELRSKNLGVLNTDIVGQSDEEYSFLDKLEHRPCTATCFSPRVAMIATPRIPRGKAENATPTSKSEARASSARARLQQAAGEPPKQDEAGDQARSQLRPATTTGLRLNTNLLLQNRLKRRERMSPIEENTEAMTDAVVKNESEHTDSGDHKHDDTDADVDSSVNSKDTVEVNEKVKDGDEDMSYAEKKETFFLDKLDFAEQRPKTVGYLPSMDESPPISPKQTSRRTSKATDFFQEEKKIDMIGLRLKEARSLDYTAKVKSFCEEIDATINAPNRPAVDYYASRLQASVAQRLSAPLAEVPGTPEDENKRALGNIFVRSLTVPALNLDYK